MTERRRRLIVYAEQLEILAFRLSRSRNRENVEEAARLLERAAGIMVYATALDRQDPAPAPIAHEGATA